MAGETPVPFGILQALATTPTGKRSFLYHKTASAQLKKLPSGSIITNLGATGAITLTLPTTKKKGITYFIFVAAAYELIVDPGANHFIVNGAVQTDDKYISADDEGEWGMVVSDGNGDWLFFLGTGTWTVQS